jgi:hypothetical protein
MGASNKYTADEQLEQIAFYWISMHGGQPTPLTVRILSRTRDVSLDLGGGNRIPKISERQARSVAELRAAGVGIDRALLVHQDTPESSDLFQAVLTMLDPQVALTVVPLAAQGPSPPERNYLEQDLERAWQLNREVETQPLPDGRPEAGLLRLAREQGHDLVIIGLAAEPAAGTGPPLDVDYIVSHAPCRICLMAPPVIPQEVEE